MQNTEQIQQYTRHNLVKKYVEGETKEQRKARKAREKALKGPNTDPQENVSNPQNLPQKSVEPQTKVNSKLLEDRFVCCLKYGDKYSSEYVNKLYRQVKEHLTLPHKFVCFTENPAGLDSNIEVMPLILQGGVHGWWHKPMMFAPNLGIKGTLLFLDLDLIVFRNIDNLFTYMPGEFCIIRDFNRFIIKNYNKFNSSVFRLTTGQHSYVYTDFAKHPTDVMKRFQGDQDWIRHSIKHGYSYWPDDWIQSYKWEMRGRPKFDDKPRGERDFKEIGTPIIKPDTSIAVFHGDPNPHNCKDPWVIDNWK